MTKKEKEILEIINNNPLIEQEDIARFLGISRSTVGVHIASLIKQGYLLGKGYIPRKENYVVGIGAANVDVYGKPEIKIKTHYDHPSKINTSVGGVIRNVLENLSLLGISTKLLSSVGNDIYGDLIINHSSKAGIDISNVIKVDGCSSGLFMQVQDENNDMYLALCDMSINKNIDKKYINSKNSVIANSKAIIVDPSLDDDVIEEIIDRYKDIPIFIDPISNNYAKKIKPYIGKIFACKPNKSELEVLSSMKINEEKDIRKAGEILLSKGLQRLYISLGRYGCVYMDRKGNYIKKESNPLENIKNASGAGDAFFAAIIYCFLNDMDISKALDYGNAAGRIALNSDSPINSDLSVKLICKTVKESTKR